VGEEEFDPGAPVCQGETRSRSPRPLIEAAERDGGDGPVVLIGIAQEKTPMWRSSKAKGQEHAAHPHMDCGRKMGFVNHFYCQPLLFLPVGSRRGVGIPYRVETVISGQGLVGSDSPRDVGYGFRNSAARWLSTIGRPASRNDPTAD
jgi:hypothetical protein